MKNGKLAPETCGNCNAWRALPGRTGEQAPGHCQAKSPMAFPMVVNQPGNVMTGGQPTQQMTIQSAFPPITANGWCREWQSMEHTHTAAEVMEKIRARYADANGPLTVLHPVVRPKLED